MSMFFTSKMTNMSTGFLKDKKWFKRPSIRTDKEASDKINVRISACTTKLDEIKIIH